MEDIELPEGIPNEHIEAFKLTIYFFQRIHSQRTSPDDLLRSLTYIVKKVFHDMYEVCNKTLSEEIISTFVYEITTGHIKRDRLIELLDTQEKHH